MSSERSATAADVVDVLREQQSDDELVKMRKRLDRHEEAFGMRMGDLFATAKGYTQLPIPEVHRLLDHPAYEPRMAAFCILDFKARRRLDGDREARSGRTRSRPRPVTAGPSGGRGVKRAGELAFPPHGAGQRACAVRKAR